MFSAFRESDYRRFWTAQFISNVGGWMQAVAQGWLVYRLTDSPFLLGFVGFAATAPAIVLMLPGGVLTWFAFTPFGNLMAGILAEQRGIGLTFVVLGAALLVTALAVARFARVATRGGVSPRT